MKGENGGQISKFADVISDVSGENGTLPNIVFETGRMAAHDIILESDVICTMQTTVVLEAAVAGKPIVLPHFDTITSRPRADEVLMYREMRHLFDTPRTSSEMKSIILDRLLDGAVAPEILMERKAAFARYVSPLEPTATEKSSAESSSERNCVSRPSWSAAI